MFCDPPPLEISRRIRWTPEAANDLVLQLQLVGYGLSDPDQLIPDDDRNDNLIALALCDTIVTATVGADEPGACPLGVLEQVETFLTLLVPLVTHWQHFVAQQQTYDPAAEDPYDD